MTHRLAPPPRSGAVGAATRAAAIALAAGLAAPASATLYTWASATSGNWTTAARWDPNTGSPTTGDTAMINATGAAYTVTLDANITLDAFTLDSLVATFFASGRTFTVNGPADILLGTVLWRASTWAGTGTLAIGSTASFIAEGASSITSPFSNAGLLHIRGSGAGSTAALTIANGFTNSGEVRLESIEGGHVSSFTLTNGALTNAATGVVNINTGASGPRNFSAEIDNQGAFNVNFAAAVGRAGANHLNSGVFSLNNATATMTGTSFTNQIDGLLTGFGNFSLTSTPTTFTNSGVVQASGGTLTLSNLAQITNASAATSTLTGGVWKALANSSLAFGGAAFNAVTNNADVWLVGSGSVFTPINAVAANNGALRILDGRNFTTAGAFANNGDLEIGGGTFTSTGAMSNSATGEVFGFGTIASDFTSGGLVRAAGGTLNTRRIIGASGTVQIDPGASLDLSGATGGSSADYLAHNGSLLNLGANSFTVGRDYTNAAFGVGNSWNRRANVSGSGALLATGGSGIAFSGDVTDGAPPAFLSFGNIHVGDVATRTFQLGNSGLSGADLRLALQTSVNGASLTDARLSGLSASNLGALAPGAFSSDITATFTGLFAGALTDQSVFFDSNFDNVGGRALSIINSAAYRYADPSAAAPNPVHFGNVHIGDTLSQLLSITNGAANDGFSERLNGFFTNITGDASAAGSFSLLGPGATSAADLLVGLSSANAGARSGSARLNLESDGQGTSELGITTLPFQTVNLSANVYRFASFDASPDPVSFGNVHVGDALSQSFTVSNLAIADGFSEGLTGSFLSAAGHANGSGALALLAAGAMNSGSLNLTLDASAAGLRSGSATFAFQSDGLGTSGLGITSLGNRTINASAAAYRYAAPDLIAPNPVNFGAVHVGDSLSQLLTVANLSPADGFSEGLEATFGAITGAIFNLAAGATNSSSLEVGLSSLNAGARTGSALVNLRSNGAGTSALGFTNLAGQNIALSANVFRFAAPSAIAPNPINFGAVHVGDALSQSLDLSNLALADGFSEGLTASFSSATGHASGAGATGLIAAGQTSSGALNAALDASDAGVRSGSATFAINSDGTGTSALGVTALPSQVVNLSATAYRYANAAPVAPSPVNFGAVHVGDTLAQNLTIANATPADGFSEGLAAAFSGTTGDASATGSIALLAAGASNNTAMTVGISTAQAGARTGSATVAFTSDGAGTSNLGQTGLASQTVNLSADVYRYAQVDPIAPGSIDFGIVHVGDNVLQALTLTNSAPADGFSESADAAFQFLTKGVRGQGSVAALTAGASSPADMYVGVETDLAGLITGSATVALTSTGLGTSGLGLTPLAPQTIDILAQVNNYAEADFNQTGGDGVFSQLSVNTFSLDFGAINLVDGLASASLSFSNIAFGPADDLAGHFATSGDPAFSFAGLNNFAGLGAGQTIDGIGVTFGPSTFGAFTSQIVLAARSTNASGFNGSIGDYTIFISGQAIPTPGAAATILFGLAAVSRRRRA